MENIIVFVFLFALMVLMSYLAFSRHHWIQMYRITLHERDCLSSTIKKLDAKCISLLKAKNLAEQKMRLMEIKVEAYKLPDGSFGTTDILLKNVADEIENSLSGLPDARFNKTSK